MKPYKTTYFHKSQRFVEKKWITQTEKWEVLVMAIAGSYAMVRRPRSFPFVARLKDISQKASI